MFLFCLVFAMFCARLFICALWSPAGKGLTSWLSFVVSSVSLSLSHWCPGSGVVLDCIDSWSLHHYLLSMYGHFVWLHKPGLNSRFHWTKCMMQYFLSFQVLQSWWTRESWLLDLNCTPDVLSLLVLCGSFWWCRGMVCSVHDYTLLLFLSVFC